ncbi:MAG: peptidylprolyl isomerase [Methylococcales bacterium]
MSRLIQSFIVVCFVQFPLLSFAIAKQSPVPIVARQDIKLTDYAVQQEFSARKSEAQEAILSNPQRFHKFIENQWVKLNLIEQVKQGAVPDNMPDNDQLMTLIDQTTIARLMINQLAEELDPPLENAARKNYQQNRSTYKLPDRAKAAHILIKTEKHTDAEAKALAEKIRAEAVSGNISFADLARKYSEDPSAQTNNGDLGAFGRGQMAKPFEDAVFAMQKPGEISSVVKTQFGYHVIRFERKQHNKINPFSAVKGQIEKQLSTQRQQTVWKEYESKISKTDDGLVNEEQVNTWLWFAGINDFDESKPHWKQAATKLSIAKLVADKAAELKFDQQQIIKQKLQQARRNGMVKLRRKALIDELTKTDFSNSVKETYISNKDQYIAPLAVDVSMIFLAKLKLSENEIKSQSELVKKQVANGDIAFEKLALNYSHAPAVKENKGHLGFRKRGDFGSQLDDIIFAQKKSGVLDPIETEDGFFIIKINQIQPEHQLTLDEVKEAIKATIVNDLATQKYGELVQSIINNPDNRVNDAAVERLFQTLKQSL